MFRNLSGMQRNKQMEKKKKNQSLNDYANAASAQGLTYGQKQAQEYLAQMRVGPVPKEYKKQFKK